MAHPDQLLTCPRCEEKIGHDTSFTKHYTDCFQNRKIKKNVKTDEMKFACDKCGIKLKFRQTLSKNWQGELMTEKRWFLGSSETSECLEKSKNIIAKEINLFIFQRNWAGSELSAEAFKNWLFSKEEVEEAHAFEAHNTFDFHVKWSFVKQLLQ